MAIKINIGVNKKIGLPDYGSASSHCAIDLEADNSILDNPDIFLQRVKVAYEVARQSVEEELAHHHPGNRCTVQSTPQEPAPRQESAPRHEPQRQEYRGNNSSGTQYTASPKQQQYIASLIKGIRGLDWRKLDQYCEDKFGRGCSQLSSKEASALIEDLKAAKSGGGGLSV